MVCAAAAFGTLLQSNGRDIDSWPFAKHPLQPTVILAILSAVANSALRYALAESLALFWWRQALNGATLKDLHLSWAYATSFSKSLFSAVDGPLLQRSSSVTTISTIRNTTVTSQLSTQDMPRGYSGVIPVREFNPTTLTKEFGQIVSDYQSRNDIRLNATGCQGVCHTRVVAPGFDERCTEGTMPYNLTIDLQPDGSYRNTEEDIGSITFSRKTAAEFNASVMYKDDSACIGELHTVDCTFRLATVSYPITIVNNTATLRPTGANDSLSISPFESEGGTIAAQFSTAGGFYLVADQLFGSNITLLSRPPFWIVRGNGSMRYTYQTNDMYNNCSITYSNPMPDIRSTLRELIFRASIGLSNSSTLQTTPGTEEVGRVVYQLNPYYLLASLCVMLTNVVAVLPLYFGWWHLGRVVSMSPLETAKAFRSPLMADAGSNEELGGLLASSKGDEDLVRTILKKDLSTTNAQGGFYGNALVAASYEGHEKVVEILLAAGADINVQGHFGDSIQATAGTGFGPYEKDIEELFVNWAKDNPYARHNGYALQAASFAGHEKVVQVLLDKGGDINARGGDHGTALQAAIAGGQESVAKILLDRGADVNAQGGVYGNALQAASFEGRRRMVKMLLKKGADVNAQGGIYGNALVAASCPGHESILQMLLAKGADVDAHSGYHGNALHVASSEGYDNVVQMLLDKGADPNVQGGEYGNALQAAAWQGHEKVIEILLEYGADVNAQGGKFGNALQAACYRGNEKVAQILLENGADAGAFGHCGNAVRAALAGGHQNLVEMLSDHGV
ncbi:Ankyrin repeat domain-containing protein 50 [Lasiodiplodia theobromae]|uniref:Ankyrin repeat domain-containing protein 50 n=1 Tax=Lasiodiplodia theobromae TaxID=45133 RepID=A0A5N5D684_9PEZI|nr:Ankyrin repeat domain-containing protein 50 [Lasiodiplodia theobromae]